MRSKKSVVVAVSGGFDPVHFGHVRMFNDASYLGDILVVLVNNDNWLLKKKGFVFMPERERVEIIEALKPVDVVILTSHPENPSDMSVAADLARLKPDIFANGGDRLNDNTPEVQVCNDLKIKLVWNVGGDKIQSSSELARKMANRAGTQGGGGVS